MILLLLFVNYDDLDTGRSLHRKAHFAAEGKEQHVEAHVEFTNALFEGCKAQ